MNTKYGSTEQNIGIKPQKTNDEDNVQETIVFNSIQNIFRRNVMPGEPQQNNDQLSVTEIDMTNTATEVDECDRFLPATPPIMQKRSISKSSLFKRDSMFSFFSSKRIDEEEEIVFDEGDEIDEMVSSSASSSSWSSRQTSPRRSITRSVGYATLDESEFDDSTNLEGASLQFGDYEWRSSDNSSVTSDSHRLGISNRPEFNENDSHYADFATSNAIALGAPAAPFYDWSEVPSCTESADNSHEMTSDEEETVIFYDAYSHNENVESRPLSLRGVMFNSTVLDSFPKYDSNALSTNVLPEENLKKIVRFEEESDNRLYDITNPQYRHSDKLDIYNEALDCPFNDKDDPFQKKFTKAEFYRELYTDEMENTSVDEIDYDSDLEDEIPRGLLYTMGGFVVSLAIGGVMKLFSALQKGENAGRVSAQFLVEDMIHTAEVAGEVIADSTTAAAVSSTSTTTASAVATTTTSATASSTSAAA